MPLFRLEFCDERLVSLPPDSFPWRDDSAASDTSFLNEDLEVN